MKILESILKKCGYTRTKRINKHNLFDSEKNYLLYNFYDIIKKMDFNPNHIVDIGANKGTWTREALKYFPKAQYTMIEPQNWLKESFQDLLNTNKSIHFFPVGAGNKKGSFMFTIVDRDDSCSFRYSEEDAKKQGFKQIEIPVVTLNELIKENNFISPDIIKIDAEGLDIEVLDGASDFFGRTEIFMIEAGVVNKQFDNSFLKIINYMDEKGYRLFEITDLNRPFEPKVLWLVELVFILKDGVLDSKKIY